MQLGNNRVWDYVGDNFVHRLLQDKDGKMVEGGPTAAKSEGAAVEEKVDSVQLEFMYLLTSQLETQRQYFEDKLNRSEQRSMTEIAELRDKLGQVVEENSQLKVIHILSSSPFIFLWFFSFLSPFIYETWRKNGISLFQEKFASFNRDKQTLEKRLQHSASKLTQVQAELSEEKNLREALELNQTSWQAKYKKLEDEFSELKTVKDTEVIDLKEQIRDLMFFLNAQKEIEKSVDRDEIAAGRIVIPPSSNKGKSSGSRGSKSHKKHWCQW